MKDEPTTELGKLLKQARTAQGLSLYELATRSGVNRSTLLRIEDGATTQPDVETLNVLARALNLDPEEFYDARWQDTDGPLPSPATYFRSKYSLSDDQLAELESAVERITSKPKKTPKKRSK
jgi:transcriptional regulator with XRE-family HTH domain